MTKVYGAALGVGRGARDAAVVVFLRLLQALLNFWTDFVTVDSANLCRSSFVSEIAI